MADYADAGRSPAVAPPLARGSSADAGHALQHRPEVEKLHDTAQMLNARPAVVAQRALAERLSDAATIRPAPRPANRTGLPDQLKEGIEALSGLSMDDVHVHRNSARPAQLQAHAYTRGTDIHLAPGQEQHLPHEAWHVVQQKQGRVRATMQMKGGVAVNDDAGLEKEADRMGEQALRSRTTPNAIAGLRAVGSPAAGVAQRERIKVTVTGLTHLVKAQDGSLMEGEEGTQVSEGQVLDIDTDQKLRSRRGPNQEIHAEFDQEGGPHFRWFRVLSVDGEAVGDDFYVRDETFRPGRPEGPGQRPARIRGQGRDRTAPEQQDLHELTSEILAESRELPQAAQVQSAIAGYLLGKRASRNKDPQRSLRAIQIACAFSKNKRVNEMVKSGQGQDRVQELAAYLQDVMGRQILQGFDSMPAKDVERRADAWDLLVIGTGTLSEEALNRYLDRVLDHGKGYAQLLESAASFVDPVEAPAQGGTLDDNWDDVLNSSRNMSIWLGTMIPKETIGSQLRQLKFTVQQQEAYALDLQKCEECAWEMILAQIYGIAGMPLIQTIRADSTILFNRVRAIVPSSIELHPEYLESKLETYAEYG